MINNRLTPVALFLAIPLIFLLNACTDPIPEMPYSVRMSVSCEDEEVLDIVQSYFAEELTYTIFSENKFSLKRKAKSGIYEEWIEGDSLFIKDQPEGISNSILLDGYWLSRYLEDPILSNFERTGDSENILGLDCEQFIGMNEDGDTTFIWISEEIPNAWVTMKELPGLPLKYQYELRGQTVTYKAESINASEKIYTTSQQNWSKNSVELSPRYYLGLQADTTDLSRDAVDISSVFYDMTTNQPMDGRLEITSRDGMTEEKAITSIQGGEIQVLLRPGKFYSLLFDQRGYAPKRINMNLSGQPLERGLFSLQMDVGSFPCTDQEVLDYLYATPIGNASYDPEADNILFDFEYTAAVNEELERIRSKYRQNQP